MIWDIVRWMGRNLAPFILAFGLALAVWVSAVITSDPNIECQSPRRVPLDVLGQDTNLLLLGDVPEEVDFRLRAPSSICQRMSEEAGAVQATIDLSTLGEGEHNVQVDLQIVADYRPVRILGATPTEVTLTLEKFASRVLPLKPEITGIPAPGFTADQAVLGASRVTISGRKSLVDQVDEAIITLDISDAESEIFQNRSVQLLDLEGEPVVGLTIDPATVTIRQDIVRPSTYRDLTVKVVTVGQPAEGYRLTNITSSPQTVTVFSSSPQLVREMPGFLETTPIDLTDATDDIERRVFLMLPGGVSIAGEQSVLVQVSIAAIETSVTISLEVEVIGLSQGLEAQIAPETLDAIVSGPLPLLDVLQPTDFRAVVDLTDVEPGLYTLEPRVEILPDNVQVESIIPASIEVTIFIASTPTPSLTPDPNATLTSTPTVTPTTSSTPTDQVSSPTPTLTPTPRP